MTWKVISVFQKDFGNPPYGINLLGGGDQTTVEERKQLIADCHARGTHDYWYCGVNSCPTVALSHETDHALCRPSFCSIIQNYHDKGNHGNCSTYWCNHKHWMDVAHAKGMHDELRCRPDPSSCLDLYKSHKTDHKLCRPGYCDLVGKLHNGYHRKEDHSLCHSYWCGYKQEKKYQFLELLKLDPGDEE